MLAHRIFTRQTEARKIREEAAEQAARRPHPDHLSNGEELEYRRPPPPVGSGDLSYIANYSKALPHNNLGEVNRPAYRALLRAIYSGDPDLFERIRLGRPNDGLNLTNPQAGLAFDLEGADAQAVTMLPAPRIDGPENSGEMGELYWMALLRDVPFSAYNPRPPPFRTPMSLPRPLPFRHPRWESSAFSGGLRTRRGTSLRPRSFGASPAETWSAPTSPSFSSKVPLIPSCPRCPTTGSFGTVRSGLTNA